MRAGDIVTYVTISGKRVVAVATSFCEGDVWFCEAWIEGKKVGSLVRVMLGGTVEIIGNIEVFNV